MQMWFKNIFIIFLISISTIVSGLAQETSATKDSTEIYGNIESYSNRSKFTRFMYRLFFKPVAPKSPKKNRKKNAYKKLIKNPYSVFEGKIIRNINIETLDPFGYTIGDTIVSSQNVFTRSGNKLHIKSLPITIRNLLLIRPNQPFDSLLVKESERLVRSQSYVRDVSFYVKAVSKKSDSVDIFIRELDNWSIVPLVTASTTCVTIQLTDKNFLGFGHEFKNAFTWYPDNVDNAYNTRYYIPNIRNSYISSTIIYGNDEFRNFTKYLSVDRPFFSPFTRWAGGINFSQQFHTDSFQTNDSLIILQRFKFNTQDYWAGFTIPMFKGNTKKDRTTNLVSTMRFMRIRYLEKPIAADDTMHIFSNDDFYLSSIGISTRKYVQDKYIFKFGIIEDVPIGKVYNITGGYLEKNNIGRLYLGMRISYGNYYSWGYLTSNFEYGSFFHNNRAERGVLSAGFNYFTGLFEIGKWKFRQFVKTQVNIGLNRLSYEYLTLNDGVGIDGFNSSVLTGSSRWIFRLQTQSYAPWNFIGFRFGPYLVCSLGTVGDAAKGFNNSKVYSQVGLGVLIKNDYLIVNTFELSLAFYADIPGIGRDIYKVNSFKTSDFGFRNFEIGKPAPVVYQ